jgi:hypothetical protein
MSQHDFDIANQTASSARSDINNALQALASLSSGDTAPSTTYANMLWYETDTNILKMRNEADSAWINVGYLDQGSSAFRILDDTQVMNTGGTQTGLLGDQATATWEAGSGTTESLISPAKVKAAIEANPVGLGANQTWQDFTGSRVIDTSYQNTTGRSICILVTTASNMSMQISTDGATWLKVSGATTDSNNYPVSHSIIVPDNVYYRTIRHAGTEGTFIYTWAELR